MKRRYYLALVLILAARLNGAIGWVPNRKPDALEAGLFHSAFESQFRCSKTPLSHGLTGLVAINSIAELPAGRFGVMAAINRRILQVIWAGKCWQWAGTTGVQALLVGDLCSGLGLLLLR